MGGIWVVLESSCSNWLIPAGDTCPARGFLLIWADEQEWQNGVTTDLHVNFGLSVGGDRIGLFTPAATQVDAVEFSEQQADQSQGRFPDGDDVQGMLMDEPTPRFPNIPPLGY